MNSNQNPLEKIRKNCSLDEFRNNFQSLLNEDGQNIVGYLNHSSLTFPTLFVLIPILKQNNLILKLNNRNLNAVKICSNILQDKYAHEVYSNTSAKKINQVLLWMFGTGIREDGISDEYDKIMDATASLLIIDFHNNTILPLIADAIFTRNKKGSFYHDLVWAFFQSKDKSTINLLSNYLKSEDQDHVELAGKLLNFSPPAGLHISSYHGIYKRWLLDNDDFIYFTGQSLQLTSDPKAFTVNTQAKYLNKKVSFKNGDPLRGLTKSDKNNIQYFNELSAEDKTILADYSYQLNRDDIKAWYKWMTWDINEQLEIANNEMGGFYD